ncbi:MAG: hypothetical protein R3Y06_09805 [Faecalibacterium sp.]
MFKKAIYGKTIPPACEYCAHGSRAKNPDLILCTKLGVVSPLYHCRRYQYDPLLRVPKRMPKLPSFSSNDFTLD